MAESPWINDYLPKPKLEPIHLRSLGKGEQTDPAESSTKPLAFEPLNLLDIARSERGKRLFHGLSDLLDWNDPQAIFDYKLKLTFGRGIFDSLDPLGPRFSQEESALKQEERKRYDREFARASETDHERINAVLAKTGGKIDVVGTVHPTRQQAQAALDAVDQQPGIRTSKMLQKAILIGDEKTIKAILGSRHSSKSGFGFETVMESAKKGLKDAGIVLSYWDGATAGITINYKVGGEGKYEPVVQISSDPNVEVKLYGLAVQSSLDKTKQTEKPCELKGDAKSVLREIGRRGVLRLSKER